MTRSARDEPVLLVVTTVHDPNDTRIREKTIRALASAFRVVFAARSPGPVDTDGLQYVELGGGRPARNLRAWWLIMLSRYDIVAAHDPELLPPLLLARWIRRKPAVFDVHEDIPAQVLTKRYLPRIIRPFVSRAMSWLLALAERSVTLTLAEEGYRSSFRRGHPVVPNYLPDRLPETRRDRTGEAVYVGDVTLERGVGDALEACGRAGVPVRVIGPVSDATRAELERIASEWGADLTIMGRVEHTEAMRAMGTCSVALSPLRDLPNYRHSVPTKVLEYLAMGVPVVATDLPATRALLDGLDAVALVPPSAPQELAESIERLDERAMIELAVAQAPSVRDRYSWDPSKLVEVYRRALG